MLPEEIELNKKRAVLERLKDRLAYREEVMAGLRAELDRFETKYKMEVGRLYAEHDGIEALIAEEEVKLVPDDEEIKKKAEELRRRAEESAADAKNAAKAALNKWQPTFEAKKAYHNLARVIHPDLALDPAEKKKRHTLMSRLNQAYSAGDQMLLNKLANDFKNSPDHISGDSIGDELVRAIRQKFQINKRLKELKEEKTAAQASELFILFTKVNAEMPQGRDLLKHMAERTRTHIQKSQRRLENLKNINDAQEEYVRDKYEMDILAFR